MHIYSTWISNIVITEKKDKQQVRMNTDMWEDNKALKRAARNVEIIPEIRDVLKSATHYSGMDVSHGLYQI